MHNAKSMNPNFFTVGRIVRTHGLKGEVRVVPMTDFPETFETRREFFLEPPFEPIRKAVQSVRAHKRGFIVKFEGIETVEAAEQLVEKFLRIPETELHPLDEGEYYWHQLEGLLVIDDERGDVGTVRSIFRAGDGGNDVLVVEGSDGEQLVPMLEEVILEVDLERSVIRVRLPEGI